MNGRGSKGNIASEPLQGFFLVSSGAEIRPLSQWDLGDFFPNLKKKSQSQKQKKKNKKIFFFFRIFIQSPHTHTHTSYMMTIYYRPILTSDGSKVRRVYLGARER